MKVRLGPETRMAGPGGVFGPGAVVELPEETAQAMLARGIVASVEDSGAPSVEVVEARVAPPEAAVAAPQRRKRRRATAKKSEEVPDGDVSNDAGPDQP